MKRLLLMVSLLAMAVSAQAEKNTATLVCRMGGGMVWTLVNQMETVQTQVNGKNVRVPVVSGLFAQLMFARASAPVLPTGAGLAAGTCGWTDRAMSVTRDDPNEVQYMAAPGSIKVIGK